MSKSGNHTTTARYRAIGCCAVAAAVALVAVVPGCGPKMPPADIQPGETVLREVNDLRRQAGLSQLLRTDSLDAIAVQRAREARKGGAVSDGAPLSRLVKGGQFARFALSHAAQGETPEQALDALLADPLGRTKALHASLTHVGLGFDAQTGTLVADFARLVSTVEPGPVADELHKRLDASRKRNSAPPLERNAHLDALAAKVASGYIAGQGPSDALIAAAQNEMAGEGFSLGRVTVAFQVVSDPIDITLPERFGDPVLSFVGLGIAQGNRDPHEPGSIAVALFVAEPQGAHSETRVRSDLPPPRSAGESLAKAKKGTLVDQAWSATLSGSHEKAASLFDGAYRKLKTPGLLYEAGRAFARAKLHGKAVAALQEYAGLVTGKAKDEVAAMIAKLEKGESIFDDSTEVVMSTEAKRFFIIGQRLYAQAQWDGAIDAFQQAYAYEKHPDLLFNIGLAHLKAGRVGTALDFFAEYQRVAPQASNVAQAKQMFDLGVELYRLGQFEAASKRFAMAYTITPSPDLLYNLALCHKAMGDTAEALRFLREFIDANPGSAEELAVQEMMSKLEKAAASTK